MMIVTEEMWDNDYEGRYGSIRDGTEILDNKDVRGRDAGLWIWWQTRTSGDMQVEKQRRIRPEIGQGYWIRISEDRVTEMQGD